MRRLPTLLLAVLMTLGACAMGAACGSASRSGAGVNVVAAENFWGNIAAQIGGPRVHVTSFINDPSADPHLYESNASDGAALARAKVVVENGLGYDSFIDKLLSVTTSRGRSVVSAAKVLGVSGNDANPHLWYDIPRVHVVAAAIERAIAAADPAHAATFAANLAAFDASLAPVVATINEIKTRYPGAPVAYTERVPGYLLAAAGLKVETPPGFASAIEDGNEPSAHDAQAMDALIRGHRVKVLCYNSQATSPITDHVRSLARSTGVPVVSVTETLPSTERSFQAWQLHQARALLDALGG